MKLKLMAATVLSSIALTCSAYAVENKQVCIDKVDKGKPVLDKEGKPVKVCKTIVVHKKLEGTKVEDAKKEPPTKK